MIITAHFLVGAAIATKTHDPVLGLFLAFLSHFILDFIPHADYWIINRNDLTKLSLSKENFLRAGADLLAGTFLLLALFPDRQTALLGGFFGALPDADSLMILFPFVRNSRLFGIDAQIHAKITHVFKKKKSPVFLGVLTQILVILGTICFLRLP
jgi:hypothetical protein